MRKFSHRTYFQNYDLSVEQYGEILVTQAFQGQKQGDAQAGYDVLASTAKFRKKLSTADATQMLRHLESDNIRIEVKSKLSTTSTGKANVVHCGKTKFNGAKPLKNGTKRPGMTHLAIVIVKPGDGSSQKGVIDRAWLMTCATAADLRNMRSKSKYIPLKKVEASAPEVIDIRKLLARTAKASIA